MKTLRVSWRKFLLIITVWGLIFLALSAANFNRFQLLNIVGFSFLAIVPGLLTIIALKLERLAFWAYAGIVVGFSILELMATALLGNTLLPLAGIARPLDKPALLLGLFFLIGVLAGIVRLRINEIKVPIRHYVFFEKFGDLILSCIPAIFPVLGVIGAISLNNGGSNIWTMAMLGGIGIYVFFLVRHAGKTGEGVIPTALFFISLALLLMTSLRGWYITGHDVQSEYRVFEIAKNAGIWSIASYRDAYNACLSITILPTLFSNLLNVPDPYVYKFLLQILFAFSPGIVYLISRHWNNRRASLLAATFFIAFPTFFSDMPFLVRQEIAFLFYGLMLYVIFEAGLCISIRRWMFMLMGIGVILSHYSTTYTILVVFGMAVASRPLFGRLLSRFKNRSVFRYNAPKAKITLGMVAILLVLSFLWTSIITNTGKNVTNVINQTFSAVRNGFGGNNRSIDAISLLGFGKPDQNRELQDYIKNVVEPIRKNAPPGKYFDQKAYDQYPFAALHDEKIPPSSLGTFLGRLGVDVSIAIPVFGQLFAKLMEALAPLGMIYLLFRKSDVDDELYLIAFFCLVFIGLNIVLPVLSTGYGIYRAMQQSMFAIAPIIVAGNIMIGKGLSGLMGLRDSRSGGETFSGILAALFFLYSTSFIPYLVGGGTAALHLSNAGRYYDNYLIRSAEVRGADWLENTAGVNPDNVNGLRLENQAIVHRDPALDIFPGLIQKNGYVFVGPAPAVKQRVTVIYNADQVTYAYPIQFLDDNKDLVYTNGGVKIYK